MEKKSKKIWSTPEIIVISKGYGVEGGANVHYSEKSITGSVPYMGHIKLYFNHHNTTDIVNHKRSFYFS